MGVELRLAGAACVVTGASSGIGLDTARRLAGEGARVLLVARRGDVLGAEVERLRADGADVAACAADLAEAGAPERVVAAAVGAFGTVDCLVNNAATITHRPLAEWDPARFDEHLAVNVRAPYFLIQQALPHLVDSAWGSVVNVSSSSGALTLRGQSVYGMTKAALDYLTASLAGELAPTGVRVNCVAPGPVDTPIHQSWAEDLDAAYAWLAEQVPIGRIGTVADISTMIMMLLSPVSSFVTGAVLPVDGGQVIRP
jgi:meso-butanediol dehydrogenase / (S,S)-butanediol dehydrogenase / diacetyl reductase